MVVPNRPARREVRQRVRAAKRDGSGDDVGLGHRNQVVADRDRRAEDAGGQLGHPRDHAWRGGPCRQRPDPSGAHRHVHGHDTVLGEVHLVDAERSSAQRGGAHEQHRPRALRALVAGKYASAAARVGAERDEVLGRQVQARLGCALVAGGAGVVVRDQQRPAAGVQQLTTPV